MIQISKLMAKWVKRCLWFFLALVLVILPWAEVAQVQPNLVPGLPQEFGPVAQLINIRLAANGLLLMLKGSPLANVDRISGPERILIDLPSTQVPPYLHKATIPLNRFGIKQVRIAQFQNKPAIARVVLDLNPNDPQSNQEWQTALVNGGMLVTPRPGVIAKPEPYDPSLERGDNTTVQRVILTSSGQLLIQANRQLNYQGSSDRPSGTYNLVITPATLSPQLQRPILDANSPLERIRLTQVGRSVTVGIKVSPGWEMQELGNVDSKQVALQLARLNRQPLPNQSSPPLVRQPSAQIPPPLRQPPAQVPPPSNPIPTLEPSRRGKGVIFIDPGHGGRDVGAVGNGIFEKDVVLPISLQLGRILQQAGYGVVYARTNDVEIDLEPRVRAAAQNKADLFISIHANSLESRLSHVNGVETYFAPGATRSKALAEFVHSQIISLTGANDRGVKSARFYVIRNSSMPAILIETGFVTNPREAANLNNPSYQARIAQAIARGIDQFLSR
ncbi:MAG: N-acetylmuramoyl-L-alanine amidase [Pseudanabaenaceae cyanobacterium bins.68]|nr:N-acetylmuramoyl-L-alanine amidase [Pseudanabaenaceae cyanobacterium bins.68]